MYMPICHIARIQLSLELHELLNVPIEHFVELQLLPFVYSALSSSCASFIPPGVRAHFPSPTSCSTFHTFHSLSAELISN